MDRSQRGNLPDPRRFGFLHGARSTGRASISAVIGKDTLARDSLPSLKN